MRYTIPQGTRLDVIDFDMLVHVDCRQWAPFYSTQEKIYDTDEYIDHTSITNGRDNNFPSILKDMIQDNKTLVFFRKYSKGKTWFAKFDNRYMG